MSERFDQWLRDKATAGTVFPPEQLAWLGLIRDHIATSLSIDPEDFEYTPFGERGGLGKAHQLFGDSLPALLDELNATLAAGTAQFPNPSNSMGLEAASGSRSATRVLNLSNSRALENRPA